MSLLSLPLPPAGTSASRADDDATADTESDGGSASVSPAAPVAAAASCIALGGNLLGKLSVRLDHVDGVQKVVELPLDPPDIAGVRATMLACGAKPTAVLAPRVACQIPVLALCDVWLPSSGTSYVVHLFYLSDDNSKFGYRLYGVEVTGTGDGRARRVQNGVPLRTSIRSNSGGSFTNNAAFDDEATGTISYAWDGGFAFTNA